MSTRVIVRSDHEGLYQERPLYCPIYECRFFIPQARIDSQGVGTCIRCAAKSCCFCGKLGVHANHLNCPVVINMMEEQSADDQAIMDLYRAMSRRGGLSEIETSVYGDEHAGGVPPLRLSIGLGVFTSDGGAMINSAAGHSGGLVGRLSLSANFLAAPDPGDVRATGPHNRRVPDPYRVNSIQATRPTPIATIPTRTSPTTPAGPVSGPELRFQGGRSAATPIAPTNTTLANVDHVQHGRSRARLPESLRRQMPDQDQIEVQRNRHRFALLRRVRQREYHRVVGSGFTHP